MTETMNVSSKRMKVILLGDSDVGKTSLLTRFSQGYFHICYQMIIPEYSNKDVDVSGVKVKLQIWDTAGQGRYRVIREGYYRDVAGIVIVFDLTSKSSFDNI
ncbi:ras-related protein Rab-26-like [Physella acuta]|uniref:ras-related protein Rab-26-like n=1 Tax=Physella acuta TaxID=109671 RepID=UPI0027DCBF68|nr:ras-related protein Rab-26-like [Physella acuta]